MTKAKQYSKQPRSIRFDEAIIKEADKYILSLMLKGQYMQFSTLVRIALAKYLKEKLQDDE